MLDVTSRTSDGSTLVVPRGELDAGTASNLAGALQAAAASERVVLDLRGLNFMDSSGLRIVVAMAARADGDDSFDLFVVRGPRRIQRVFEITRMADRITWIDDPGELPPDGR